MQPEISNELLSDLEVFLDAIGLAIYTGYEIEALNDSVRGKFMEQYTYIVCNSRLDIIKLSHDGNTVILWLRDKEGNYYAKEDNQLSECLIKGNGISKKEALISAGYYLKCK